MVWYARSHELLLNTAFGCHCYTDTSKLWGAFEMWLLGAILWLARGNSEVHAAWTVDIPERSLRCLARLEGTKALCAKTRTGCFLVLAASSMNQWLVYKCIVTTTSAESMKNWGKKRVTPISWAPSWKLLAIIFLVFLWLEENRKPFHDLERTTLTNAKMHDCVSMTLPVVWSLSRKLKLCHL